MFSTMERERRREREEGRHGSWERGMIPFPLFSRVRSLFIPRGETIPNSCISPRTQIRKPFYRFLEWDTRHKIATVPRTIRRNRAFAIRAVPTVKCDSNCDFSGMRRDGEGVRESERPKIAFRVEVTSQIRHSRWKAVARIRREVVRGNGGGKERSLGFKAAINPPRPFLKPLRASERWSARLLPDCIPRYLPFRATVLEFTHVLSFGQLPPPDRDDIRRRWRNFYIRLSERAEPKSRRTDSRGAHARA